MSAIPGIFARHEIGKEDDGAGLRYSFVITQAGEVFEGRGFDLLAGAVKDFNDEALSVQHITGEMEPSAAALSSMQWLYRQVHDAPRRPHSTGTIPATVRGTGHGDHLATSCPGGPLRAWITGRGQELYAEMDSRPADHQIPHI